MPDLVGPSGELLSRHFAQLAGNAMKPDAIQPAAAPLLFDGGLQAKPAYYVIVDPDSLCDSVVVGRRSGAFPAEDRTCVEDGAELRGAVTVTDGATVHGSVTVSGGGSLVIAGSEVRGAGTVEDSLTAEEPADRREHHPRRLAVLRQRAGPTDDGSPNTATGGGSGQCAAITARG